LSGPQQRRAAPIKTQFLMTDAERQQQKRLDSTASQKNWRGLRYGHRTANGIPALNSNQHDTGPVLQSAASEEHSSCDDADGFTPTTPEALQYAEHLDAHAQALQVARTTLAKCCTVVSGSDAGHCAASCARKAADAEPVTKALKTEIIEYGIEAQVEPLRLVREQTCPTPSQTACILRATQAKAEEALPPMAALQANTDSPMTVMPCKKKAQGYASPFSFTFGKPVTGTKTRAISAPALGTGQLEQLEQEFPEKVRAQAQNAAPVFDKVAEETAAVTSTIAATPQATSSVEVEPEVRHVPDNNVSTAPDSTEDQASEGRETVGSSSTADGLKYVARSLLVNCLDFSPVSDVESVIRKDVVEVTD